MDSVRCLRGDRWRLDGRYKRIARCRHPSHGLAIVSTGAFLGRFVAAVLFGTLWSIIGPGRAFTCFALAMPVAVVCTRRMMAHIDNLNSRRTA